jgi:hypothetical protein
MISAAIFIFTDKMKDRLSDFCFLSLFKPKRRNPYLERPGFQQENWRVPVGELPATLR